MKCLGPVIGTISQDDIDASIQAVADGLRLRPISQDALGHNKRGVEREQTRAPGKISLDEDGRPFVTKPEVEIAIEPCGQDMQALIEAVPRDGKEYQVTCPSCGNVMPVLKPVDEAE